MEERREAQGQVDHTNVWVLPLLAGMCAFAFLVALLITQAAGVEAIRPDSASYLYFDPSRSIGYPVFLWTVRAVTGDALLAVPLQMSLLAASLGWLAWRFHGLVQRRAPTVALLALLLCSPEMWKNSASLVTEAVATSMVALWCAQLLRLLINPTLSRITALALFAAAATLVRPSLVPLLSATVVPALLLGSSKLRFRGLTIVGAALLLTFAANPVINYLLHGSRLAGSPVARGVLQHSLFCPPRAAPRSADSAFVEDQARRVRQYISTAPPVAQPVLKQLYSGELRFGLVIPTLGRRHGFEAGWQTDHVLMGIALERIAGNPTCYLRSALKSYYRLATYDAAGSPNQVRQITEFLLAHPPIEVPSEALLPVEEQLARKAADEFNAPEPARPGRRAYDPPKEKPVALLLGARALHGIAAALGIIAILSFSSRRTRRSTIMPAVAIMGSLGVAYHGVFLVTALVEFPLMRYTVPIWPVLCTQIGLLFVILRRTAHDGCRSKQTLNPQTWTR